MAIYNTTGASIQIGNAVDTKADLGIVNASVQLASELVDVTEVGAADRSFVTGIRGGTITGACFYDQGNAVKGMVEGAVKSGATLFFTVTLHSGATISGTILVENWSPEIAVNDMVRASFSFRITGQYTIG